MRRIAVLALLLTAGAGSQAQDAPLGTPDGIINEYFEAKWKEAKIKPADKAEPHAFYRRVILDLTGRLPAPSDVRRDAKSKPRVQLIDETMALPVAGGFFGDLWMQWLNAHEINFRDQIRCDFGAFHAWLAQAWDKDMPYDAFVRSLLADRGGRTDTPAVNYSLRHIVAGEPPVALAAQTARLFLAKDIRCAQCHDEPFGKMQQEEFWQFAAFFRPLYQNQQFGLGEGSLNLEGKAREEMGERFDKPKFLDGRTPDEKKRLGENLADFVLTTQDFQHARAIVDRYWKHFFGRALGKNHQPLLDALVRDFMANRQSLRRLVRGIMSSRPYQLASDGKAEDREAYAVGPIKFLNAVQFTRAYADIFELEKYYYQIYEAAKNDPQSAAAYRDPQNMWLTFYRWAKEMILPKGRDPEETLASGTVRLSLKFMNNRDLQLLIAANIGVVHKIVKEKGTTEGRVEELFYTVVGRPPTADERAKYSDYVKARTHPWRGLEDIMWMLVNSGEFIFIR